MRDETEAVAVVVTTMGVGNENDDCAASVFSKLKATPPENCAPGVNEADDVFVTPSIVMAIVTVAGTQIAQPAPTASSCHPN
jgi:hypothetical protein